MLIRTSIRSAILLVAALSLGSTVTACGGGQNQVKTADHIKPGAMPRDGEWRGVYYNQLYGMLHLTESGGAIQGAWRTEAGDKWGEMYGEAEGDLFRYTWKEHKIGVVGPNSTSEGKGYFKYTVPKPEEPHVIEGEWGLGDSEMGHSWSGLKQLNQEADPKSVRPNELEGRSGVEGFDGNKGDASLAPQKKEGEEGAEADKDDKSKDDKSKDDK